MRVGVTEWAEPLIVLLSGRIPQGEDVPQGKFLSQRRSTSKSRFRRSSQVPSAYPYCYIGAHKLTGVKTRNDADLSTARIPNNDQLSTYLRHNGWIKNGEIPFRCSKKGVSMSEKSQLTYKAYSLISLDRCQQADLSTPCWVV